MTLRRNTSYLKQCFMVLHEKHRCIEFKTYPSLPPPPPRPVSKLLLQLEIRRTSKLNTVDLGNFVPLLNFSMCSMSSIYPKR